MLGDHGRPRDAVLLLKEFGDGAEDVRVLALGRCSGGLLLFCDCCGIAEGLLVLAAAVGSPLGDGLSHLGADPIACLQH